MNLNPRLSFLAATALCALPFLFATASAHAVRERIVGTVNVEGEPTVLINKKPAQSGTDLRCGDIIETDANETVTVTLASGQRYVIDPGTKVRLTCDGSGPVRFLVIYGGIHPLDTSHGDHLDPLPYLAAFGFGNFSFPSIGGGSSSNGNVVSVVLPGGRIAFFDSAGNFVRFN